MSSELELRPATAADEAFLLAVYASTREEELALVPWDEATKGAFLRMQFAAQDRYYRQQFPDASFHVVTVDGVPAGRLCVDRRDTEIGILDIALLPDHRGRGIGTALLTPILDEAERTGKTVSIHVERGNPARRLYDRLGFVEVAQQGVYLLLRRHPRIRPQGRASPGRSLSVGALTGGAACLSGPAFAAPEHGVDLLLERAVT